jgi:Ca-activated chloride channel homolog
MLRASILMLLGALGVVLAAQQPTPFKGGTRTVAVYATVTQQSGRLVPDLTRDDFEVADNGKRQDITVFANDIQPITVVMMLDRSGSMQSNFRLVANAAEQFVTDLLPADKARIGSFSNRIQVDPRDFTSDHNELISILRTELQEAGPTPLWNAVNVGITALLHQQGRRVILVFTDGVDFPMNSTSSSLKEVMTRAEEEDVMVYAIGLAGRSFGGGRRGGGGGFGRGGRGGYGGGYGGRRPTQEKPDEGLPKIAAATGGGYFELTSTADLTTTFARVADELHHQYVLGFSPVALDGKMHKLEVRVKRPGMSARARKSYLASTER